MRKHRPKSIQRLVVGLVLLLLILASQPSPALAQGSQTSLGSLQVSGYPENLSVYANFSGDSNANNNATLEYKLHTDSIWKVVTPFVVDRRTQVSYGSYDVYGPDGQSITLYETNLYANQYRGVIFWLTPNTQYDVRVTFTDGDGVLGSNSVTQTVTTMNDNPTSSGTNYYVSPSGLNSNNGLSTSTPWQTISHAIGIIGAGAVVNIMPGTYTESVNCAGLSGASGNPITFRSYNMSNKAVVDGAGGDAGFNFNESHYIRVSGINIQHQGSGVTDGTPNIRIDHGSSFIIIEDCNLLDGGLGWPGGGIYIRCGVDGGYPCSNIIIQRNTIVDDQSYHSERFGIYIGGDNAAPYYNSPGTPGVVIKGNTIHGIFKDCISGHLDRDVFIYNNELYDALDDGMENEGSAINCASWGNYIHNTATTAVGNAPICVGPYFFFRNVLWLNTSSIEAGVKFGNSMAGTAYYYHNTIYSTRSRAFFDMGNNFQANNMIWRNNIMYVGKAIIDYPGAVGWASGIDFDYDSLTTTWTNSFAKWRTDSNHYQQNLAQFRIATSYGPWDGTEPWISPQHSGDNPNYPNGFEPHGITGNPMFVDAANGNFALSAGSPCIGAGVSLPYFNDANSPWPSLDMGAIPFGTTPTVPPTVTTGTATVTSDTTATITGSLDTLGTATTVQVSFDWGTTTSYGYNTGSSAFATAPVPVQANLTGLTPGTTYYYRIRAVGQGTAYGSDATFTTTGTPPVQRVLTVTAGTGGSILVAGTYTVAAGSTNSFNVTDGSSVSLVATPAGGYIFGAWTGPVVNTASASTSITMTSDFSVTASFTPTGGGTTFGLNSGSSTYTVPAGYLNAMLFTAPETGTLTQLELQVAATSPSGNVRMGVYASNQSLLLDAGERAEVNGWNAISGLSLPITAGTQYWLAFIMSADNSIYRQPAAGSHIYMSSTYGAMPSTFSGTPNTDQYVMRATYTTGVTPGTPTPTPTTTPTPIPTPSPTPGVMAGDANGDGTVNSLDITKIERIIVELDAQTPGADANGDGNVNVLDITRVEMIIVGR